MIIFKSYFLTTQLDKICKETSGFIKNDQGDDDEKYRNKNPGLIIEGLKEKKRIRKHQNNQCFRKIYNTGLHCIPDNMTPSPFGLFSDYWC